jgi:hypothetical protein
VTELLCACQAAQQYDSLLLYLDTGSLSVKSSLLGWTTSQNFFGLATSPVPNRCRITRQNSIGRGPLSRYIPTHVYRWHLSHVNIRIPFYNQMNDNFRGVSRRLMCLQISRQWWIYLCASLRGWRRGACISCLLYPTLTTFKRNGCLSGVPIEEWCVLDHFLHYVLLKLLRRFGNSRQIERIRPPKRHPGGGTTRRSKHGYPIGRAVLGSFCCSQGRPAIVEKLRG